MISRRQLFALAVPAGLTTITGGPRMGDQLLPRRTASDMSDFDRRLRALESAQRSGYNRLKTAWCDQTSVTLGAVNSWRSGTSESATWTDSSGGTGTGFAAVTVETGTKVMLIASMRPGLVSTFTNYKTNLMYLGVGIDSADPAFPGADGPLESIIHEQTSVDPANVAMVLSTVAVDLTPGQHTFRLMAYGNNYRPAAATYPVVQNLQLTVIPLD